MNILSSYKRIKNYFHVTARSNSKLIALFSKFLSREVFEMYWCLLKIYIFLLFCYSFIHLSFKALLSRIFLVKPHRCVCVCVCVCVCGGGGGMCVCMCVCVGGGRGVGVKSLGNDDVVINGDVIKNISAEIYLPYSHQISPHLNFRPSGGRKLKGANWAPKLGEERKLKGANWAPRIGGSEN